NNRRLEMLRVLSVRAAEAQTVEQACKAAAEVLANDARDIPFAAVYVPRGERAVRTASAGLSGEDALPRSFAVTDDENGSASQWSAIAHVVRGASPEELIDLGAASTFPGGPWPEPARHALAVPIPGTGRGKLIGLLVAGLSPRRALDDAYRSFVRLV